MSTSLISNCSHCGERCYRAVHGRQVCFTCAFWEGRAAKPNPLVIDGRLYAVGKGLEGRSAIIEYFDGRWTVTFNIWEGAKIPAPWRHRIPDTARFVEVAENFSQKAA